MRCPHSNYVRKRTFIGEISTKRQKNGNKYCLPAVLEHSLLFIEFCWIVLNVIWNKSQISIISPICQLNRVENGNKDISSGLILAVQKPVEVPF
jgi:hypothetical protein